jgi:ankyrin repeat protein
MPSIETSDFSLEIKRQNQALIAAAEIGDAKAISTALAAGADIDATDDDARTAAMHAAHFGHDDCLQTLVVAGADLHATDGSGWTAAMFAAWEGQDVCLQTLIAAGANHEAKDYRGRTAHMLATQYGRHATASLIDSLVLARDEAAALDAAIPDSPPHAHHPTRI